MKRFENLSFKNKKRFITILRIAAASIASGRFKFCCHAISAASRWASEFSGVLGDIHIEDEGCSWWPYSSDSQSEREMLLLLTAEMLEDEL